VVPLLRGDDKPRSYVASFVELGPRHAVKHSARWLLMPVMAQHDRAQVIFCPDKNRVIDKTETEMVDWNGRSKWYLLQGGSIRAITKNIRFLSIVLLNIDVDDREEL
jgi:hypothetical protein